MKTYLVSCKLEKNIEAKDEKQAKWLFYRKLLTWEIAPEEKDLVVQELKGDPKC